MRNILIGTLTALRDFIGPSAAAVPLLAAGSLAFERVAAYKAVVLAVSARATLFTLVLLAVPTATYAAPAPIGTASTIVVANDPKLTPAVAQLLQTAATQFATKDYRAARETIANARALADRTAYDDAEIDYLYMEIEVVKDCKSAFTTAESLILSPALSDARHKDVYEVGFGCGVQAGRYWRAIQFAGILQREHLFSESAAVILPYAYFKAGAYADAERAAQAAISTASLSNDDSTKLAKLIENCQVREGKKPAMSETGAALLGALGAALVSGLSGQHVDPPPSDSGSQMAAQQADAAAAFEQAQQKAAAAVLAADPAAERAVYADLVDDAVPRADAAKAERLFQAAFDAWQRQDYGAAERKFDLGLALNPANAAANYYYADCLTRQSGDTLAPIDFLARAVVLGGDTQEGQMAREALQQYASPAPQGQ